MISTRLSSIIAVLGLAACVSATPVVRYSPVLLPQPATPILTPVPGGQLHCLSADTYTTIVQREQALRTYGQKLRGIIQANNEGVVHAK